MERSKRKSIYSRPLLEIIDFQQNDIISTSGDIFGDDDHNPDSWTKPN